MITTSVNDVLATLEQQHNGAHLTKEAAATPPDTVDEKRREVDAVLEKIASAVTPNEKTASAENSSEDAAEGLRKMAAEIEYAENVATLKQAELFGAAVCDSFIRRGNQYAEAAMKSAEKTAADQEPAPEVTDEQISTLVKTAAAKGAEDTKNIVLKLAAAAGAKDTQATIEKAAAQAQTEKAAEDNGLTELANLCEHCFHTGFTQINELLTSR